MEPELDAFALRVLGSLLEKEVTVPATYPLTMNGLLSACNQTSGRDPIMSVTDHAAEAAIDTMKAAHLVRLVHASHGARMVKYRQVADETLQLDGAERAVLTVLLLRGAQTPGELRSRSERLHAFSSTTDVEKALDRLAARGEPLVRRLDRRAGHKEHRWTQLLGGEEVAERAQGEPAADAHSGAMAVEPFLPALAPLARFIGRWTGAGAGEYPTIDGFAYTEEIELRLVRGKAMLAYRSATSAVDDGRVLHGESGWLRVAADGHVELIVAQGSGLVEIAEGFVEEGEILLSSTLIGGSSTAKDVTATERRYRLEGNTLRYELAMAAVGLPLSHHLQARLTRSS